MEHEAGRELDALIAREIFGHDAYHEPDRTEDLRLHPDGPVIARVERGGAFYRVVPAGVTAARSPNVINALDGQPLAFVPAYSTDIAAAWLIVEELAKGGKSVIIEHHTDRAERRAWAVGFWWDGGGRHWGEGAAPTAPLAICRACLAVVEVNDGE